MNEPRHPPMNRRNGREAGAALIMTMALLTLLLGFIGSALVPLAHSDARRTVDERDRLAALYIAEGTLEVLQWELVHSSDLSGDGIGVHSETFRGGTAWAVAAEVSPDVYELAAVATVDGFSVTLSEIAVIGRTASVPDGALSVVGNSKNFDLSFSKNANLIVDGGPNSPAIAFTKTPLQSEFSGSLEGGIDSGYVDPYAITGNGFEGLEAIETASLAATEKQLFNTLRKHVAKSILPHAQQATLGDVIAADPSVEHTFVLPQGQVLRSGETLTGQGTLVLSQNLRIEEGAQLDWHGDIIVIGKSRHSKSTLLSVSGGLDVTGNVIVVAAKGKDATLAVDKTGDVHVSGNLLAVAGKQRNSGAVQLEIENDLHVEGLLTTSAAEQRLEFGKDCDVLVEGLFQTLLLPGRPKASDRMSIEGSVELVRHESVARDAIVDLTRLGVDLDLDGPAAVEQYSIQTYNWEVESEFREEDPSGETYDDFDDFEFSLGDKDGVKQ